MKPNNSGPLQMQLNLPQSIAVDKKSRN